MILLKRAESTTSTTTKPVVAEKKPTPAPQPAKESVATSTSSQKETTTVKSEPVLKEEKKPEKSLDWKKHVKEFDLKEEATVNGIKHIFISDPMEPIYL